MSRKLPRGFATADPDAPGPAPKQPTERARKATTRRNKWQRWTRERKDKYLAEFRKHGRPGVAAKAVGASKRNVVRKRESDPEFDLECRAAWEDFQEWTIGQVQLNAWEGHKEPIMHGDRVVGVRTVRSTKMMELEARRVVPEYRDSSRVELSGDPAKPVEVRVDHGNLSTEDLRLAHELAKKAEGDE